MRFGRRREDSAPLSDDLAVMDQDESHYEYILKEMYVPSAKDDSSTDEKNIVDLVFVHGLGGNLKTTWKQEGTTEPWFTMPEFLGRLKDSVRVLSFGYNAHRFSDVGNTRIIHHANDLLRNLVLKRLDNPDRPLIFIAHSLGGLVVKRAILLCATNDDWKAIKQATRSIVFMGTPHMGSEKAEDLVIVQRLASLIKFQAAVATNLTKELRSFSTAVQDINLEFTIDVHRSIKLLCCYESHPQRLPNGIKEIIVPQWSAVLQGVDNIDLNCTHSGLPKFASPSHPRFEIFWGEVQRLVKSATSPQIKFLKKAPTWADKETLEPAPPRPRPTAPSRHRREVGVKSRDPITRSSVDKLLKEFNSRVSVDAPVKNVTALAQSQTQEQLEKIDPEEFNDYLRYFRTVTTENKGLDREAPHWQTCSWIMDDPTFFDWRKDKNGSLLFITGSPGCGKSNLAKYIQDIMTKPSQDKTEENLVIPFYCDSLASSRQNPPILDFVVQSLLSKHAKISQMTRKKIHSLLDSLNLDRHRRLSTFDAKEGGHFIQLMEIFQLLVTAEDAIPACLIIDGLDQCEDEFVLRFLRGLDTIFRRERATTSLKVVITSRMADSIRGFALANRHIEITPDLTVHDIQRVVDEEVDRIILSRQIATIGRTSISAVIVERSNGSFLFASSVLKELWYIKDTGANSVFTLVTSCPSTMKAIYQQDMEYLQKERHDLFQLIQIVCIAGSTLRIPEAREILRLLNPEVTRTYDLKGELARMCQRLIRLGSEDTLELQHQTLYDFITKTYDLNLVHKSLIEICLEYLLEIDWEEHPDLWIEENQEGLTHRYPLLREPSSSTMSSPLRSGTYIPRQRSRTAKPPLVLLAQWDAAVIIQEALLEPLELSLRQVLNKVAGIVSHISSPWTRNARAELRKMVNYEWEGATALHYAAAQSGKVLELLLPFADDIDLPDYDGATPLILAAAEGGLRAVQALLEAGADVNAVDARNQTALFYAVLGSSGDIARTLLEHGADPDISCITGHSPLELTVGNNNAELARILLEFSPDLNAPTSIGKSLVFLAKQLASRDVLEVLIPHVDVDEVGDNERLIHKACFRGWGKVVEKLIHKRVNLNEPPAYSPKATPVALAAQEGHNDILRALLAAGAAAEYPASVKSSPLHIAAASDNVLACKLLLRAGAYINAESEQGQTPLSEAADTNSLEVVKCLVSHGADPNKPESEPPLHIAVDWGNIEMVQVILAGRSFPRIDAKGSSKFTALGIAASAGRLDMVSILLDHGADPNLRNGRYSSSSSLQLAALNDHKEIMMELLKRGAGPYPENTKETSTFHVACRQGWLDVMETFLEIVDDVNELVNFEWGWAGTPLRQAASGGKLDAVEYLIKKGANPDYKLHSRISNGQTIVHAAAAGGNVQVLDYVLKVATDTSLEVCDLEKRTPLWCACLEGRENMVEYLLEKGASTEVVIKNGETILPVIVCGGSDKILRLVLEKNPSLDIDPLLDGGETPLLWAVIRGHAKVVSVLLERGADINRKSKDGNAPVFGAIYYRRIETLRLLLEHEHVDLTHRDFYGRTALQIAQQSGSHQMPAMVLAAAKDPATERILTENRDMLGLNAYDQTRFERKMAPSLESCIKTVRRDAQDLLDNFNTRGMLWDRLGKFLLQLESYSFALVALQRGVRVVETSPLMLEHWNYCDCCLEAMVGIRYVCRTCCTMDLCEWCVERYPMPGSRVWTCQYHSFFKVHLPRDGIPKAMERIKAAELDESLRLSSEAEEKSSAADGEEEVEKSGNGYPQEPAHFQPPRHDLDGDEGSICSKDAATVDQVSFESSQEKSLSAVVGFPIESKSEQTEASANERWTDRTDDQLREFLDAILKTFTTDKTPDDLAKWSFAADNWKLEYDHQASAPSQAEEDENPLILGAATRWEPPGPYTPAYYYLSGLAYVIADTPPRLAATKLPFLGYEREALRKKRRLKKVVRSMIFHENRDVEVVIRRAGNVED
ncbi:hypothetical protein F66182_1983 [Fusarium sp. NRRL 66182]|nr:hypothetical protein F66182_1983 [Fusarium sp. NRRL 66182]